MSKTKKTVIIYPEIFHFYIFLKYHNCAISTSEGGLSTVGKTLEDLGQNW